MLDKYLDRRLFRPKLENGETRVNLAADEAVAMKKCVGSLRYLWRNSPTMSHDPAVQEMKDLLLASPAQDRNAEEHAQSRDEGGLHDAEGDGEDISTSQSVDDGEPAVVDEVSDGAASVGAIEDEHASDPGAMSDTHSDDNGNGSDGAESMDSLKAPTLRLRGKKEAPLRPVIPQRRPTFPTPK